MGQSGVKKDAFASYGSNTNTADSALGNVSPIYRQLATGSVGMTPQQVADARSGIMQTQGGTQAAATGVGDLIAARTGNVGGYQAAVDDAARTGGVTAQNDNLQLQNESTQIQRENQKIGLGGESSIYETALNAANGNLNTANQASTPFWQKLLLQGVATGGDIGAARVGRG